MLVLGAAAGLAPVTVAAGVSASPSGSSSVPEPSVMIHAYPRDGAFHFAPAEVRVAPGGTVVLGHLFGNHSLTSPDGLFNETGGPEHWPAVTAPSEPGTYRFYCWLHADPTTTPEQGMAGVLVVGPAPAPEPAKRDAPVPSLGLLAAGLAVAVAVAGRRGG